MNHRAQQSLEAPLLFVVYRKNWAGKAANSERQGSVFLRFPCVIASYYTADSGGGEQYGKDLAGRQT